MKSILLTIITLIATANCFGQGSDVGETVEIKVQSGEMVHIHPAELEGRIGWAVVDDTFKNYRIDEQSKVLYLAPQRSVDFLLVVAPLDVDARIEIYRYRILVGSPDPDVDPEPSPVPPVPVDEYTGPNDYGLGIIAYEASRAISDEAKQKAIVQIDTGIKRLQGVGGILFISSPNSRDSIFKYMRDNLDSWCDPVIDAMEAKKNDPLRLKDWLNMLNEVKAGVNHE